MDFEKIYKQFNEASLVYKDEYGFEVKHNNEWYLVYGDNIKTAESVANELKEKFKKDVRIIKGGNKDYHPL